MNKNLEQNNKFVKLEYRIVGIKRLKGITLDAVCVLSRIMSFTESGHVCYITDDTLSKEWDIKPRRVQEILNTLESYGIIKRYTETIDTGDTFHRYKSRREIRVNTDVIDKYYDEYLYNIDIMNYCDETGKTVEEAEEDQSFKSTHHKVTSRFSAQNLQFSAEIVQKSANNLQKSVSCDTKNRHLVDNKVDNLEEEKSMINSSGRSASICLSNISDEEIYEEDDSEEPDYFSENCSKSLIAIKNIFLNDTYGINIDDYKVLRKSLLKVLGDDIVKKNTLDNVLARIGDKEVHVECLNNSILELVDDKDIICYLTFPDWQQKYRNIRDRNKYVYGTFVNKPRTLYYDNLDNYDIVHLLNAE